MKEVTAEEVDILASIAPENSDINININTDTTEKVVETHAAHNENEEKPR